ncbi:prolyl oligopeptidase family serine peptidase [Arthrobacter bussei]|uniref:Acyl-peptide hydrolase n=1 Tax=Arthrobacter bussei TaxID=2594179 RepID=A0A7X1TPT6_9MICC|nr:prolyl oligopeptidase family serine peptidase [Arthrobacter bussei]MPY12144.1 S9 family peptidase [Arthrobacter bussei]
MTTPFSSLEDFVALPRLSGLVLNREGTRLVTSVATLDPKKTAYQSALWEIDPSGAEPARRLTRSSAGESGAAFLAGGDLLFTSARPDPEDADGEKRPSLWRLPATGGEASLLVTREGGMSGVLTAAEADVVVLTADALAGSTGEEDDAERRKARKDSGVAAILHAGYPVRYWDADLGPDEPRYLAVTDVDGDGRPTLDDLVPSARGGLRNAHAVLSPDGRLLFSSLTVPEELGSQRSVLVRVDLATRELSVLLDDRENDYTPGPVSPDGRYLAVTRDRRTTAELAPQSSLLLLPLDGGEPRQLAADWDRWPSPEAWLPDGSSLVATADDDGGAPVVVIDVATGAVRRVTEDTAAYSDVRVSPDGRTAYAVRSSYLFPAEVVRIDLATGATDRLQNPAERPELPGTLERVESVGQDGQAVKSWLVLPEGASADAPVPALLWIHGGPIGSWNAWTWRWSPWVMAARGYAVLLPDPALSTGYGQHMVDRGWGSWGAAPYTDLMAATDDLVARDDIDGTRVAAMGGSFGGYMANWVAGHTARFAAIVTHASLWALDQFGGTTDAAYYWAREMTPEAMLENSPHSHIGSIDTPMLVIHGDKDYRVPIGEGLRLWYDLLSASKLPANEHGVTPHRFLYFPDENHWILKPQHAKIWYSVVEAFLASNVLGEERELPRELGL